MDIYAAVTDRIIEQMEQGIIPWQKPWISNSKAISHATGKPYSLLNQLMLGRPGEYLTFKQCQEAGGKVKRGEKASMVVFWKFIEQEDEETGEKKEVPFLRYYNVFHIDQCEGVSAKYTTETAFPDGADTLPPRRISSMTTSAVKVSSSPTKKATEPSTGRQPTKLSSPSVSSS